MAADDEGEKEAEVAEEDEGAMAADEDGAEEEADEVEEEGARAADDEGEMSAEEVELAEE